MSKVNKNLVHFQAFDNKHNLLVDYLIPLSRALDLFNFCVELSTILHFNSVKEFRIVSGGHVMYQFRDVRSMIVQHDLFNL